MSQDGRDQRDPSEAGSGDSIEVEALRLMLSIANERLAQAKELLTTCAPLTWVMTQDADGAHEWEKQAYRFLTSNDNDD